MEGQPFPQICFFIRLFDAPAARRFPFSFWVILPLLVFLFSFRPVFFFFFYFAVFFFLFPLQPASVESFYFLPLFPVLVSFLWVTDLIFLYLCEESFFSPLEALKL